MTIRRLPVWGIVALLTVLPAGCGGGNPVVVRPPAEHPTVTSTAAPATSSSTGPASSLPAAKPTAAVAPATGLAARQAVHVTGTGFTPNETLVVNECADKGPATGPADCNLGDMTTVTADSTGRVAVDITVLKGPFGANQVTCGPAQPCLVSISQATPSPAEEANAQISFG